MNKKLTVKGTGITCTLKFTTPYFKKGERKKIVVISLAILHVLLKGVRENI